jgi:hypothetical protein
VEGFSGGSKELFDVAETSDLEFFGFALDDFSVSIISKTNIKLLV